ncbi:MAG: hypothetical protein AAF570_03590, partial [Bacteroidota bacterium]
MQKWLPKSLWLLLILSGCAKPLTLTEAPAGEVGSLPSLIFEFSRDLAPKDSLGLWLKSDYVEFEPPIQGSFRWLASNRLKFSPSSPLEPAMDYKGKFTDAIYFGKNVRSELKDVAFHTPKFEAQTLTATWSNRTWYNLTVPVELTLRFNHKVSQDELQSHVKVLRDGEAVENIRFGYSPLDMEHTLYVEGASDSATVQEFSVVLSKGLMSNLGRAPLEEDQSLNATLAPATELKIEKVNAKFSSGQIYLEIKANQKIDPDILRAHLTLAPAAEFNVEEWGSKIRVTADFKPGSLVNVAIRKDLPGLMGGRLPEDFSHNLTLPHLPPMLRFADHQGRYLMKDGMENLNVKAVNVPAFEVRYYEIYENNLLHFLNRNWSYDGWYSDEFDYLHSSGDDVRLNNHGRQIGADSFKVDITREDLVNNIPVNVQKRLKSGYQGILAVELSHQGERWLSDNKIISLSDMGLIAKRTDKDLLVFVNRLSTARPVPGARVQLISSTNQSLLTATTDGNGIARFRNLD